MEIIIIVLLILAFPIWVITRIHSLSNEIAELRNMVQTQETGVSSVPVAAEKAPIPLYGQEFAARVEAQNHSPFTPQVAQIPAYSESEPSAVMNWLTEDVFMKLGALMLLIAFGWFVSYAFMNNWIGPVGRISLGLLAGVAIMGLGTWRIQNFRHQGAVFLVLGSGVVLLTMFAARELYDFLTPGISLLIMFMSVAYVAFVSVLYQSEKLSLAGLLMAAGAPLLTSAPEPSVVGLMTYLLVVVLGAIWVVRLTGSHLLTLASIVIMLLYSLPFVTDSLSAADETMALFFSFIFATVFFVTNTISIIKVQTDGGRKVQIYSALLTGVYLMMWIGAVISPNMQSLAYVFWMLVFSVGSFLVYTQTINRLSFFIYGAVTIGLLFAATAAELSGPLLTLAYTAEVTAIILFARQLLAKNVSEKLVWLLVLPVVLSLESFASSSWNSGIIHSDFVTLVVVGGALGLVGYVYLLTRESEEVKNKFAEILLGTAFVYFLALIWLILHAVLSDDVATTLSLITYTILGLGFFITGQVQNHRLWQVWGGVLLAGVVIRLLLIDVWQMDLVGRIITFFIVGVLLVSTAFIGKVKKQNHNIQQ